MTHKKQIILIGGAPTAGKSMLAEALAKKLDLPWISTDQIREIVKGVVNENDHPILFAEKDLTANEFYAKYSAEEIVEIELKQAHEIWNAVKVFIKKNFTWRKGFVMEGVSLLPELIAQDFKDSEKIKAVFVIDKNKDRIRKVIFERGLWGDPKEYSDEVKEIEVIWVSLYGERLEDEAKKHGYPIIEMNKDDTDLESVLKTLAL